MFNWSGKAGEPTTTLYNVDKELMESPFFWESGEFVCAASWILVVWPMVIARALGNVQATPVHDSRCARY